MTSSMGPTNMGPTNMGPTNDVRQMPSQQVTGMPNHLYDLVSIIYHAMKSEATSQQYVLDAQQSGDNDLLVFFQQVQQDDRMRIQRSQQLLAQKLAGWQPTH